ncbi:hypothetical protein [Allopontixanthobacter sp.]|uniref:hypothetical protein n=1 Tax=Allopontixanthobacter sp. TaxID=2906452 RepID=UPI002ABAF6F5|nr:hypothetical protein [Allopontixanthobacter sp.]MDZ4308729.1 hypothetical protein [Allopontixanthobacter sp.]
MIRHSIACLFLILVWDTSARANEIIGPNWSSNRILDLRDQTHDDAIVFDVRSDVRTSVNPAVVTSGIVRLADDFDYVSLGDDRTITDYRHCRVFSWKVSETIFANHSCFAGPAFRKMELQNRLYLSKVLNEVDPKAGQELGFADAIWLEQEFATQVSPSDPLSLLKTENGLEWRFGDQIVATLSQEGFAFDAKERRRFARYLSRHINLHPQVREAILDQGIFPSTIKIVQKNIEGESVETLSFSPARRRPVGYPLAPDMTSGTVERSQGVGPQAEGLGRTLSVIDGTTSAQKPTFQELLIAIETQAKVGESLAATLKFLEMTQLYGAQLYAQPAMMDELRRIMPSVAPLLEAGDGANFWAASNLAGNNGTGKEREAAAAYLIGATSLDELDFGTFRFVTFANLVRSSSDSADWDSASFKRAPSLTDAYWIHIAAQPWSSNTFKDLGDHHYSQFETFAAWEVWDLGRAIDPDWQGGSMKSLEDFENAIKAAMADCF